MTYEEAKELEQGTVLILDPRSGSRRYSAKKGAKCKLLRVRPSAIIGTMEVCWLREDGMAMSQYDGYYSVTDFKVARPERPDEHWL